MFFVGMINRERWNLQETIEGLVDPEFPDVVEAEVLRPDADHAPAVTISHR